MHLRQNHQNGFSIIELLAVVAIMGVLAAILLPRATSGVDEAECEACFTNQGNIELQCQLWRRNNGSFPAANLLDVGASVEYFPGGLPTCPVDGTTYTIDTTTGLVTGHSH